MTKQYFPEYICVRSTVIKRKQFLFVMVRYALYQDAFNLFSMLGFIRSFPQASRFYAIMMHLYALCCNTYLYMFPNVPTMLFGIKRMG